MGKTHQQLRRLSPVKQRRLNQLMSKNSRGTITAAERTELEKLVQAAQELAYSNAQQLAEKE
jgi:hypothetical protein